MWATPPGHDERLTAWLRDQRQHRHGRHRYVLGDGCTEQEVNNRFAPYVARFRPVGES